MGKWNRTKKLEREARQKEVKWTNDIAYFVGLITSDGSLKRNRPNIAFYSKDKGLVKQARNIAESHFNISNNVLTEKSNGVWQYQFTSRLVYEFFNSIGVTPNKSSEASEVDVPDNVFNHWFRGEIDGDGSWYVENGLLHLKVGLKSKDFLAWLSNEIDKHYHVGGEGNVNINGPNSYYIRYGHKDSTKVAKSIYSNAVYYLERKYNIVNNFI